jgi:hypothetical protein
MASSDKLILVTEDLPGNMHQAARRCNELGFAPFVLQIDFKGGNYSLVLMRMTEKQRDIFKSQGKLY